MTRLKRMLAIVMAAMLIMSIVPPVNADEPMPNDELIKLYPASSLAPGSSYALIACGSALSAEIASNGGGLLSDPLPSSDFPALYESQTGSDLWTLTDQGTLYNSQADAFLSLAMSNLILSKDEASALCAEIEGEGTVLLYSGDTRIPLTLDAEKGCFTVSQDPSSDIELTAYTTVPNEEYIPVEDITLSESKLTLTCGETATLTATVIPSNATDADIVWSSSDESVATVDGGTVNALAKGEAVIRAASTDGLHYAECSLTVLAKTYTVRFLDYNDRVISTQTVEHGSAAERPADPYRTGYTFLGWDRDFACVTEDMDIRAMYSINYYTVNFYDGYSGKVLKSEQVAYGDPAEPPSVPVRTGYDFVAWSPSGYNRVTYDMDIYAVWQLHSYSITYNTSGGVLTSNVPRSYTVESADITLPTPEKAGYTFMGWHKKSDLSDSAIAYIPSGSTGDITLYAEWKVISYSIKYELGGGSFSGFAPASYTVESSDIVLPTPARRGYTFMGWYDNSAFTGSAVSIIKAGSTGNRRFYAKWELVQFTIQYVTNGGYNPVGAPTGYSVESPIIDLPIPTRRGYTFMGWHAYSDFKDAPIYFIPSGSTGNITLYAEWRINVYSITYVLNGGTNPSDAPGSFTVESGKITLPTPERAGYTFIGFFENTDFSGDKITEIPAGRAESITLYAKWQPVMYTISYVLNGGQFSGYAVSGFTVESGNITLPTPVRTAYDFMGWYLNPSFTGVPVSVIAAGSIGSKTYYARWQPTQYKITYHEYGGTMPEQYETSYTIESSDIPLPRAQKTGHVLVGWYPTPELSGVAQWKIPSGSYGDLEFYANWRAIIYQITFVDMYDNVISTTRAAYGTAVEPPEPPEYEGYTFTGWSEDLSFVYGDMTIKAQYKVTEYDVVFVDIDYSVLSEQKVKHGQAAEAPVPPEHDDMTFVFWSTDFSCVKSNLTVVAVYRSNTVTPPVESPSNYRFESVRELTDGASYIITTYSVGEEYALSSLDNPASSGLWGLAIKFENAQFKLASDSGYGLYDVMFDSHYMYSGVMLTSPVVAQSLAGGSGELSFISYGDEFVLKTSGNRLKLYNTTQNNYLCFNSAGKYFYLGAEAQSVYINVYKLLRPKALYDQTSRLDFGDRYSIVAVRPDGSTYMLTSSPTSSGGLIGVKGTISNNRFYLNHEVDERAVVFRVVGGSSAVGFNIRNAKTNGFLSKTRDGDLIADSDTGLMGKWVYKTHPESGLKTLYDEQSGYYLFCTEDGEFKADSKISHTEILLFSHKYIIGNIGDLNNDGRVNAADSTMILRYRVRLQKFTSEQIRLADVNGDGRVNTGDAMYLLKYVVCLVDWLGS